MFLRATQPDKFTYVVARLGKAIRLASVIARRSRLVPTRDAIFVDLMTDSTLGEYYADHNIRTLYHIFRLLGAGGNPIYINARATRHVRYFAGLTAIFPNLFWLWRDPARFEWAAYCTDRTISESIHAGKTVHIRYDQRPSMPIETAHFNVPYGFSIGQLSLKSSLPISASPPRIRVAFAGNFNQTDYDDRRLIADKFGKLTRYQIITELLQSGQARLISDRAALASLYHRSAFGGRDSDHELWGLVHAVA